MSFFGLPSGTAVWKAHGTGNSFVVLDDPYQRLTLTAHTVAALCSPRFGVGADGLLRAVRGADGVWFMDYRNADGSEAEMCGNGIRVFVDHLRDAGWIQLGVGDQIPIDTRGGRRHVRLIDPSVEWGSEDAQRTPRPESVQPDDSWYQVDMGPAHTTGTPDVSVRVPGLDAAYPGLRVAMPNPHTVIWLDNADQLSAATLPTTDVHQAPEVLRPSLIPDPPAGTNLELVVDHTVPGADVGHVAMRVLERGVGETFSCGTGCCAVAVAAAVRHGAQAPSRWLIDVPGGTVVVDLVERGHRTVFLSGPATRVAQLNLQ